MQADIERIGARDASEDGSTPLTLGFIPLVDAAPLIVAKEKGFAAAEGLALALARETSWANIRDRVMLAHFDAAHMLGPMPIASTLGIGHVAVPMIAPFSLGLGGNAITLSPAVYEAMEAAGAELGAGPAAMGRAFAAVVARGREAGRGPLTLAVVHPFSGHNYELRYWLASSGIDPDRDVRIIVLPPPFMVDAVLERQIDGFCVGEPWNSLAVEAGAGVIVATKSALWRQGPEKVLGFRADFAERSPETLAALLRALSKAAAWAGHAANHAELSLILAAPAYLGTSARIIARALSGSLVRKSGSPPSLVPDFLVFHDHAANFPWQSHALWFYSQMVRWGQVPYAPGLADTARRVYRPDLYRAALAGTGIDLPRASAKVEGALKTATPVASRNGAMILGPDGFFDGRLFDPDEIEAYIASF
ncbi:CmpA/NrtA family ABC transporter substrate-binding protein [Labrys monachus]|uniref:NitT/TauT family transport system ATP-binding protein n=1 Tax=Labrys monachus TaxID=217067 RepID=A0ABU0FMF7_9HYPH|nr:CmpA/NrtA family ABC transporter substrate-binding protein [Labrys monachus]MDQ0395324.1 NitT/TauT family transport system ATP-binding protein [Labrys monachus]